MNIQEGQYGPFKLDDQNISSLSLLHRDHCILFI